MIEKSKKEAIEKALIEGKTISYIRKELHSSFPTIRKIQDELIDKGVIEGKRVITEEFEKEICEAYKNGNANRVICSNFAIGPKRLKEIIEKYGIEKKVKKRDFSKFYNLDSPETQYWLGFICADGCVVHSIRESGNHTYLLQLTSKDDEILNKYKNYFGDYININKGTGSCKVAQVGSKELCEYFINELNITPRKSLTLDPKVEYSPDFIRGYFDGDGFISNNKYNYRANFTSGSKIFLEKLQKVLEENNIHTRFVTHKHIPNDYYTIEIERKNDLKTLYYFMYQNATVCLTRKLKNFVSIYGNIDNSKVGELLELQENQQPSFSLTTDEGSTTNS